MTSNRNENITSFYKKYFIFERDNYYLFKMQNLKVPTDQFIIKNRPYPYSNCKNSDYSKFRCINDCSRNFLTLSKYFYNGNET